MYAPRASRSLRSDTERRARSCRWEGMRFARMPAKICGVSAWAGTCGSYLDTWQDWIVLVLTRTNDSNSWCATTAGRVKDTCRTFSDKYSSTGWNVGSAEHSSMIERSTGRSQVPWTGTRTKT